MALGAFAPNLLSLFAIELAPSFHTRAPTHNIHCCLDLGIGGHRSDTPSRPSRATAMAIAREIERSSVRRGISHPVRVARPELDPQGSWPQLEIRSVISEARPATAPSLRPEHEDIVRLPTI